MRLLTFILLTLSFNSFANSDALDWNQWALNNSGQILYKESGEIYTEAIKGKANMDIGMPSQEKMNALEELDREIVVAVIDRGIDMNHPKFKGRIIPGRDFLDGSPMKDDNGHGTHVAGIIAANADGGGVRGVTPKNVKILPLKVLSDNINGFIFTREIGDRKQNILITDIIADAINYATEANVDVINMSLGWPKSINTTRIEEALDNAASKGIVLVAAAGNNNKNVPLWPCSHAAVICVGSMNNQGEISEFSNHGGKVDLITSGEWIVSLNPRELESRTLRVQGQEVKNGSSQAAPFVSSAAALLKLKYPNITADQVKATLYNSADKVEVEKDGLTKKFVRYGRLNIDKALKMGPSNLFNVNVKNLVSVKISRDGNYNFTLPLERLGNVSNNLDIKISGLDGSTVTKTNNSIEISGKVLDVTSDSEKDIMITATNGTQTLNTPMTLSFATVIDNSDLISTNLSDYPANKLLRINGSRKVHAMGVVSEDDIIENDFISYTTATDSANSIVNAFIFTANANDSQIKTQKFELLDHSQFLAVFKKDINLDGQVDFMFYGLSADRKNLLLTFFNKDGSPLFNNNSTWTFPITGFTGLPLIEKELSDFSWIKVDTFLGEINVPYFKRAWTMPEEDNGKDLLDFETGRQDHYFYLLPTLDNGEVTVSPRAYDSINLMQKLKREIYLEAGEGIQIENIIPQTKAESLAGRVRHMVSVGEDFYRRYYILTANKVGEFSLKEHVNQDPFQIQNMFLKSFEYKNLDISKNTFQMALLNRSSARVGEFSESSAGESWKLETSGWSNPFFQVIGAFQGDEKKTLFFESRYHVYVYEKLANNELSVSKLPINRDSSFPGVEFSETLKPALIKVGTENKAGIAVDSTLIYGDRLYSMLKDGENFTRPISLSVNVPANCIPLKTRFLKKTLKQSSYTLLCEESNNQASIKFFPLGLE